MDQGMNTIMSTYVMLHFMNIFELDFVGEFGRSTTVNLTWTSRNIGEKDETWATNLIINIG